MPKTALIYARIDADLKTRLKRAASACGESESVVVREALRAYLTTHTAPTALHEPASPYKQKRK